MSSQFEGRLIFPGGKRELKPFTKEMKKLRSDWVAAVNWKYRKRVRLSVNQWADLADDAVDILIGSETSAVLAFIAGLEHHGVQEDVYTLVKDASRIMDRYGAAFYQPGGTGTRDPGDFEAEAEEILARFNSSPRPSATRESDRETRGVESGPPRATSPQEQPSRSTDGPANNAYCTTCGREFRHDDQFCGNCGKARKGP